jgi:hypothetical protein
MSVRSNDSHDTIQSGLEKSSMQLKGGEKKDAKRVKLCTRCEWSVYLNKYYLQNIAPSVARSRKEVQRVRDTINRDFLPKKQYLETELDGIRNEMDQDL